MKKDMTPRGMRDRFRGTHSPGTSRERMWDEGQTKEHKGAPIAPAKGGLSHKTDSRLSQSAVMHPARTDPDRQKGSERIGYPKTGGPHMSLGDGHGPVVRTVKDKDGAMKGGNPRKGAMTKGPDKSPKGTMKGSNLRARGSTRKVKM